MNRQYVHVNAGKEVRAADDPLLLSSMKYLKEAKQEMGGIYRMVEEQGEKIGKFQMKVLAAESVLRRTSRVLRGITHGAKRRRMAVGILVGSVLFIVATLKLRGII